MCIRGRTCTFSDIVSGFSRTSPEMLVIAFVCTLLFMIWITDVAALYGFTVGRVPASLLMLFSPSENILSFLIWSSLLGAVLAFVIFSISAFSVPLLYYRRAGLVQAVFLSVTAVFSNLVPVSYTHLDVYKRQDSSPSVIRLLPPSPFCTTCPTTCRDTRYAWRP